MKKVMHLITRLDRGGAPEDVLYNCINLQQNDYSAVIVYGKTEVPSQQLMDKAMSCGVRFMPVNELVRDIKPLNDLAAFIKIFLILYRENPDILHTHTSKAGFLGRWAAFLKNLLRRPRTAILHATHGHVLYGYYSRLISYLFASAERLSAHVSDRIIVLTENEIREHLRYGIGKQDIYTVIHSGIEYNTPAQNTQLRASLGIPEKAVVVGSVGRLDPVKGYVYMVEAIRKFKDLHTPELCFLLVGEGSQRELLERNADTYGIKDRVVFTGWKNNIEEYMNIMDIYVQPSVNEGLGKTILYAQMLGKPVIASRVQGIVSIINDGETGVLVPPCDPGELARAIETLSADAGLRKRLGNNAAAWIRSNAPDTTFPLYSVEYMNYLVRKLYASFPTKK